MEFHESGLPKNPLIEKAFNYSQANARAMQGEVEREFTRQLGLYQEKILRELEAERNDGKITKEDYMREKAALEQSHRDQMKMIPTFVRQDLASMFRERRLGPALEIQKYSDNASPELTAAVMLVNCVRSPVDYQRIAKEFGEGIAGLIAEVHHIDAYPSERRTNLSGAGRDTKRAYLSMLVANLHYIEQVAKQDKSREVIRPPGQEETLFESAQALWGNDPKLDQRFLEAFNAMAAATASPFRMEIGEKGAPELVKGSATPKGPRPPKPGAPPGDEVF